MRSTPGIDVACLLWFRHESKGKSVSVTDAEVAFTPGPLGILHGTTFLLDTKLNAAIAMRLGPRL
jgi:hypothetical protein